MWPALQEHTRLTRGLQRVCSAQMAHTPLKKHPPFVSACRAQQAQFLKSFIYHVSVRHMYHSTDFSERLAGATAPQGSSAKTNCLCEQGFSGPNGGDCNVCASGKYKEALGAASCQDCPAGKTSPPGSVSSALCDLSCAPGSFGPDGGTCENCPGLLLLCVCLCARASSPPSPYPNPIWRLKP